MPPFIYFDVAATLLRPHPSVGQNYADLARQYGIQASGHELENAFRSVWEKVLSEGADSTRPRYGTDRQSALAFWTPMVKEVFRHAGCPQPPDPYFQAVYDYFKQPQCWALYDDVEPALDLLEEAQIPYGVLSNFDERLASILKGLGLFHRFSAIVFSGNCGVEKPHPAIFRLAEEKAQSTDCALIGDNEDTDGRAALRAGWRQCLILRAPPEQPPVDLAWRPTLVQAVTHLIS